MGNRPSVTATVSGNAYVGEKGPDAVSVTLTFNPATPKVVNMSAQMPNGVGQISWTMTREEFSGAFTTGYSTGAHDAKTREPLHIRHTTGQHNMEVVDMVGVSGHSAAQDVSLGVSMPVDDLIPFMGQMAATVREMAQAPERELV